MNFIEFIGFVISFGAVIFLFFRRMFEERDRRLNPEKYAKKEQDFNEFLKSLQLEEEDDDSPDEEWPKETVSKVPPVIPMQNIKRSQKRDGLKSTRSFESSYDHYKRETALDKGKLNTSAEVRKADSSSILNVAPKYEVIRERSASRGLSLITTLHSRRDMVILNELFGKPLSMRNPDDWLYTK